MTIYLKVYTREIGMDLKILWEVVAASDYFRRNFGREVRLRAGDRLYVAFQGHSQHYSDPLGESTLEQVCRIHASGATVTYRVDMRSDTPVELMLLRKNGGD